MVTIYEAPSKPVVIKHVIMNGEIGTAELQAGRIYWHRPARAVVVLVSEITSWSKKFSTVGWRDVTVQLRSGAVHVFRVRKKNVDLFIGHFSDQLAWRNDQASEKQIDFLDRLYKELGIGPAQRVFPQTKGAASDLIDLLKRERDA